MPNVLPEPSEPTEIDSESEPASVWLIEVPSLNYRWFTEEREKARFYEGRKDAAVTPYARCHQ